jgi:energy-coupling factor transporter ATP-binding protein EcfA2
VKKIRIKIARSGTFGKFSSREMKLGNGNFVVVSGKNESGKSTLAELISWTLAGRRFGQHVDKKFITFAKLQDATNLLMDARIEGLVDTDHFTIERQFTIRASNRGQEPAAIPPTITVNGEALNADDWAGVIKIRTDRDYSRIYRIMDPYDDGDKKMNLQDLVEVLSFNTDLGITPKEVEDLLDAEAATWVNAKGKSKADKPFALAHSRLEEARKQHETILNSNHVISSLDDEIEKDENAIIRLGKQLEDTRTAKGELVNVGRLLDARDKHQVINAELSEMPNLDSWDLPYENRADVESCLKDLIRDEKEIDRLSNDINRTSHELGVQASDVDVIAIDRQTVDQVAHLQRERLTLLETIESESTRRIEKTSTLKIASESLERSAVSFETTFDHLLALGEKSLDDQSFGDPILNWNNADIALREANVAESRIENSNVNTSPHQRRLISIMGVSFALTTVAMLIDQKIGIGIAAVGIIAILAPLKAPKRSAENNSSSTPTIQNPKFVNNSNLSNDLNMKREKAHKVLKAFGFNHELSLEQATGLRSERIALRELVQKINSAREDCQAIDKEIAKRNQSLSDVNDSLSQISVSTGISTANEKLTESIALEFLKIVGYRDQLRRLQKEQSGRLGELEGFLGNWVINETFAQIQLKFDDAVALVKRRNDLRAQSEQSRQVMETSAPPGSSIAKLLGDEDINDTVITERLKAINKDLARLEEEKTVITGNIALNKKTLGDLEKISDLPEVIHKKTQAREERRKYAMMGAAGFLARKIVGDVRSQVESNHKELVVQSSEIAHRITDGFWTSIANDDNGVRVLQDGQWILEDALSAGARDVLRLSIRLAAARAHSQSRGVALPLILDDPTASLDKHRCPRLFEVLKEFAEDFQIILMTHDSAIVDLAVAAGATEVSLSPA